MTDSNSSEYDGIELAYLHELLHDLFTGQKLATVVLENLCRRFQKTCVFNDTTSNYHYANYVSIENIDFPQGIGKNKKNARAAAARQAMACLLDINEEQINPQYLGQNQIFFDCHGHTLNSHYISDNQSVNGKKINQYVQNLVTLFQDDALLRSKGTGAQLQQRITGDHDRSSKSSSSGRLTAITRLADYCKQFSVTADIVMSTDEGSTIHSDKRHLAKVHFGLDRTVIATGHGSTAFEAKSKAADRAMIILSNRTKQLEPLKLSENASPMLSSIFDQHCQLIADFIQYHREQNTAPIFQTLKNRFYAAFILKRSQSDLGKVVAFGVGSRCSSPDTIDDDGCALLDCHALAMARRALLQYFYGELHQLADGCSPLRNIFLFPQTGKIQLKNNVSIHLILSDAPNGDAKEYLPSDANHYLNAYDTVQMRMTSHVPIYETNEQGRLRYKYVEGIDTISATHRQQFGMMSCSDKILKWNVLGVQGALLANLIEPIKVTSITHSNRFRNVCGFQQQHTSRAYCCRLNKSFSTIAVHHPQLGRAKNAILPSEQLDHQLSYSWSLAYSGELIDALTGRPTSGGISVISKAILLSEYKQLCLKMCQACNIQLTYNQLKQFNKEYFQQKQLMIQFLEQANFGYWSQTKIHLEQFKYSSNILPLIRNNSE